MSACRTPEWIFTEQPTAKLDLSIHDILRSTLANERQITSGLVVAKLPKDTYKSNEIHRNPKWAWSSTTNPWQPIASPPLLGNTWR